MNAEKAQWLRDLLMIAGAVLMLASVFYEPLFVCGLVVLGSSIVPDYLYNKCPHCGKHLGERKGKFCQNCGKSLEE